MGKPEVSFGERVRSLREAKGIGLRQFALRVGMSATYLSKIERGELVPPSEEKIRAIARQFAANEDEFLALAGRLPSDLSEIIRKQPRAMAAFLRTAGGLPLSKIQSLTDHAAEMKKAGEACRRSGVPDEAN
jgi:HTH-type transcriptional regulator, competence development regulator